MNLLLVLIPFPYKRDWNNPLFLWAFGQPHKLTSNVRDALQNPENVLILSVVSVWEMQIKVQIGKLNLPLPVKELVMVQRAFNQIQSLPVVERHIWMLGTLPMHHKDPFDRLLIAQAKAEKWRLVTADPVLAQYPVQILT
ncbi:MAG: type II toxin-antitoxin system VapC family toxin [Chloroflexota bacterium]|nr:type II toxin-antitoxin system VapC family toxin [Chloroflexota bacterium]